MSQSWRAAFGRLFKIREGEFSRAFLMGLYAFNCVAAITVGRVVSSVLFLSRVPLTYMPLLYVAVAVLVGGASFAFAKPFGRLGLRRGMNLTFLVILASLVGFRVLLAVSNDPLVVPALAVGVECMVVILMVHFWSFANELFNAREAKRLFGVIGGGQMLANLYNFPIKALKDVIGIENLLFVCAFSIILCALIVNHLFSRHKLILALRATTRPVPRRAAAPAGESVTPAPFLALRNSLFALTIVTMLSVTLLDYQFRIGASHAYKGADLADFFFSIYAYTGILSSLFQFFVTPFLLERLGILHGLLILPVAFLSGSVLTLGGLGFTGVVAGRAGELVTRYTIHETSVQLLYQPLPARMRRRVKTLSDGLARPLAQTLGGLLCLALSVLFAVERPERLAWLSVGILVLGMAWVWVAVRARGSYVDALLYASRLRVAEQAGEWVVGDGTELHDLERVALQRALASEDTEQMVAALRVARREDVQRLAAEIAPLLGARDARVREAAARAAELSEAPIFASGLNACLEDEEPPVAAAAIRAVAALEHEAALPRLQAPLAAAALEPKAAAIEALLRYGGLTGLGQASAALAMLVEHPDPAWRARGMRVVAQLNLPGFAPLIAARLNDPAPTVRRAAILAAGERRERELIPALILAAAQPSTSHAAVRALANFSEEALEPLRVALRLPGLPLPLRLGVVRALAELNLPEAYTLLEGQLDHPEAALRGEASRGVERLAARLGHAITPDVVRLRQVLFAELALAYERCAQRWFLAGAAPEARALDAALEESAAAALERALYVLGVLYPRDSIDSIRHHRQSDNPTARANALEIADNILDGETKRALLPLLDTTSLEEKADVAQTLFPRQSVSLAALLAALWERPESPWQQAAALHAMAVAAPELLPSALPRAVNHPDPLLRETALSALRYVPPDQARFFLGRFAMESDPVVRAYAATIQPA